MRKWMKEIRRFFWSQFLLGITAHKKLPEEEIPEEEIPSQFLIGMVTQERNQQGHPLQHQSVSIPHRHGNTREHFHYGEPECNCVSIPHRHGNTTVFRLFTFDYTSIFLFFNPYPLKKSVNLFFRLTDLVSIFFLDCCYMQAFSHHY